ncbi:hypothetical protein O3P69_010139 [Scylla paramamosain]|uniref:Uncharacterized protein n=1 Tax=Scylla paramamosain TaxID=85552 RepID=A0AAW0TSG0_SCYPA
MVFLPRVALLLAGEHFYASCFSGRRNPTMDDECLSLTWNNHGATYRQTLSTLRKENTLTDITLACDGQKFSAHKLVLVTCSDYFRTILGDLPCHHPIVYMRGVTAQEMQALIDFMYTGQTDIPQKEVPTLLSTAEALQIKGLGVFNGSENHDSGSKTQRERGNENKRKRCDLSSSINGLNEESGRSSTAKSLSREDQFLENLYSHHYAFLSSPKQRKLDEKNPSKIPDFISGSHTSALENSPHKESSSSAGGGDSSQNVSTSLSPGILNNLLHHRKPESSRSSLPRPPSPIPQSPQDRITSETGSSHTSDIAKESLIEKDSSHSSSSQPPQPNPRLEAKAASPRALNYSLAGLGGSKDSLGLGLHGHPSEESSSGHGDTPENLIKTEIKEEALDFSSSTMSENHHSDSPSSALSTNNIGEETRMYLDAFARSANLSWQQNTEETVESSAGDGRPFVCPICNKCFAKAAILKRHHLAHFRPYVCHLCPRSFTRREVLAEHMLEHTGADLRMPCPVCGMTIKRKRNLQAHIKVKHPDYYQQKSSKREAMC